MYSLSLYPVLTSQPFLSMELGWFMTFSGGKCFLDSSEKKTPNGQLLAILYMWKLCNYI